MNLHRLLCGFGVHWFWKNSPTDRECMICFQQQHYIEDVVGREGFWFNVSPTKPAFKRMSEVS